ncbi:hypothetical protein NA57DRAFT_53968 [Rhizodiscina lignyota]|uniref:UBC core domain-containing protein n=1 Tax=Rhizodiscina lignyota TaxID=1504668 RepID=A0A9P4IMC2_9PEZI|nr:hypothetical protein NA57DRAFT_53968 [Rhizodiscina lignyota]
MDSGGNPNRSGDRFTGGPPPYGSSSAPERHGRGELHAGMLQEEQDRQLAEQMARLGYDEIRGRSSTGPVSRSVDDAPGRPSTGDPANSTALIPSAAHLTIDERDIKAFASKMLNTRCSTRNCRKTLVSNKTELGTIFALFMRAMSSEFPTPLTPIRQCVHCHGFTCIGCGTRNGPRPVCDKGCVEGGLFVVWVFLCGFDHLGGKTMTEAEVRQRQTSLRPRDTAKGTGYDTRSNAVASLPPPPYTGFYAQPNLTLPESRNIARRAVPRTDAVERDIDFSYEKIMRGLTMVLPALDRNSAFDRAPPRTLAAMILRCSILDKAAELLRNDSINDVLKRSEIYIAVLNFTSALVKHPSTAITAVSDRTVREKDLNLLELSFHTDHSVDSARGKVDVRSSLAKAIRNIAEQSQMILQRAARNPREFSNTEDRKVIDFCRSEEEWHREHSVSEIPDDQLFARFHFAPQAANFGRGRHGRMSKLVTELANMKTSLPMGIFVRYAESRIGFMKVLIVGPRDTPYENGLFEFDLLCGYNYPYEPPKLFFRGATIEGSPREINPNLHKDGTGATSQDEPLQIMNLIAVPFAPWHLIWRALEARAEHDLPGAGLRAVDDLL